LDASFETTKAITERGVTVKAVAKADKGSPAYGLELAYEPTAAPGLKVTVNSDCTTNAAKEQIDTNKITVLYKRASNFTIEESLAYTKSKLTISSAISAAYQAVRAGASALATITLGEEKKTELDGYGVKLGYVPNKDFAIFAAVDAKKENVGASSTLYYKKNATEAAGEVAFKVGAEALKEVPKFSIALSHAVNDKTTLKAKLVTAHPAVAFALKHQLSDALSVTFASECAHACPKDVDAKPVHKHGLSFNLKL
jgi:hypothetical protein